MYKWLSFQEGKIIQFRSIDQGKCEKSSHKVPKCITLRELYRVCLKSDGNCVYFFFNVGVPLGTAIRAWAMLSARAMLSCTRANSMASRCPCPYTSLLPDGFNCPRRPIRRYASGMLRGPMYISLFRGRSVSVVLCENSQS